MVDEHLPLVLLRLLPAAGAVHVLWDHGGDILKQKFWVPHIKHPKEIVADVKDSLEVEPELFTDYLCIIIEPGNLYHVFRPADKTTVYDYKGFKYSVERENAFRLRGWTPWKKHQPFIPWSVFAESTYDKKRKTGLLLFRQPDVKDNTVSPVTNETAIKLLTPKFSKAHILNPHLRNYRRKQKFQTTGMGMLMWGLVGVLVIVAVLVLMGQLHLGG